MIVGAFGEVMMRLEVESPYLLNQSSNLKSMYTGTGVNVLAGLSRFEIQSKLLTILPENNVGEAALGSLRQLGIDVSSVKMNDHHMGIYFLEKGVGLRPSEVTYMNREQSAFNQSELSDDEIKIFVNGVDAIFFCGISLMTSEIARKNTERILDIAVQGVKQIYFDFNVRSRLQSNKSLTALQPLFRKLCHASQLVLGNLYDITTVLGLGVASDQDGIRRFMREYHVDYFANTSKQQINQVVRLQGHLHQQDQSYVSRMWESVVVDNIGTGDAFTAGLIYGMQQNYDAQQLVDFASANAILAYTVNGDCNNGSQAMVERLLSEDTSGLIR